MRVICFASVTLAAFAAGCGDSTGPSLPSARSVALRMDTLYTRAVAESATDSNLRVRIGYIALAEIGPALGAAPRSVQVITATGPETWRGVVFQIVDTAHHPCAGGPDSSTYVVLYPDDSVSTILVAQVPTGAPFAHLLYSDTATLTDAAMTASASRATLGGACSLVPGLADPTPASLFGVSVCTRATFTASATVIFPATTGLPPALRSLSIAPQTFNGERLLQPKS